MMTDMARLSVNLDDELYRIAKAFALSEEISLSKAVNVLLRRGMDPPVVPSPPLDDPMRDFPTSPAGRPVTSKDVAEAEEWEYMRYAGHFPQE